MSRTPDAPEPGVPASIAAIMASIRREVAAAPRALESAGAVSADESDAEGGRAELRAVPAPGLPPVPGAAAFDTRAGVDAEARALLAPMLQTWLDANLPEIVETAVHAEIRRLTGLV